MNNTDSSSSPCAHIGSFAVPLVSGIVFSVFSALLLLGSTLLLLRRRVLPDWHLRLLAFFLFLTGCTLHAARSFVKALSGVDAVALEDRLLGAYNLCFLIASAMVAMLCIRDAKRSITRAVCVVLVRCLHSFVEMGCFVWLTTRVFFVEWF